MRSSAAITARYLEPSVRRKIRRDKRNGVRVWRIARDTGLSIDVVIEFLVADGFDRRPLCKHHQIGAAT